MKNIIICIIALVVGIFIGNGISGSKTDTSMEHTMESMTSSLEGKTGDELDQTFLKEMIIHHEGAVAMAETLQAGTEREELQKMAKDIIEVQTGEIKMMQEWLSAWFEVDEETAEVENTDGAEDMEAEMAH